jgi:8-oxo-dGTP pyrophosphatase MutT (NUDIX family)
MQEVINIPTELLPMRKRVEVIIKRITNKYLLIFAAYPKETPDWRGFPGGGNDGKTDEETCIEEVLEEIGMKIKCVQSLGIAMDEPHVSAKGNHRAEFSGSTTKWYSAMYEGMDDSKLGADGDIRKYEWLSYEEAVEALRKSNGPRVAYQLMALTNLKNKPPRMPQF